MREYSLNDLGFEGPMFTSSNGRRGVDNIQVRLDRVIANGEFSTRFNLIKVNHLSKCGSDHVVVRIVLEHHDSLQNKKRQKLFRFEESWAKEGRCEGLVATCWRRSMGFCRGKIESIKNMATKFEDHNLGKIKKELVLIEKRLEESPSWGSNDDEINKYKDIEKRHTALLKIQETMWCQRSRAMWLKDGNSNTKFFHGTASQRNKVNHIRKLKGEHGSWWRGEDKVGELLINYFQGLFSSSNPSVLDELCEVVKDKLCEEHKQWCNRPFSSEEVQFSVQQIHPLKAPGPDGLSAMFYQKYISASSE